MDLPALDFLQTYPVMGQELLVDHVQGQVDGRPAPFQVERRVQFGGHQHAHLVLDESRGGLLGEPWLQQLQQQPRGHRPPRRQHHSTAYNRVRR